MRNFSDVLVRGNLCGRSLIAVTLLFLTIDVVFANADESDIARILEFRNQQIENSRGDNEKKFASKINFTKMVRLNGINHVINVRGNDRNNPVLLFLHGGAGWPILPLAYKYFRSWENEFIVVQWDQRGAGKTHCANPTYDASTATFEDFLADAEALVEYLRITLKKKKIILLGASWGSALGVHLIKKRPKWFSAYIGTGQVTYGWEQEIDGYNYVLREAYARDDKEGVAELLALRPYPGDESYIEKLSVQRKYAHKYGGGLVGGTDFMTFYNNAFFESPDYTLSDWRCFYNAITSNQHKDLMDRQFKKKSDSGNLHSLGYNFDVPIFFFLGTLDEYVSMRRRADYLFNIVAPQKRLVLFDNSAHAPPLEEPEAFLNAMKMYVLPVVVIQH